MVKTFKSIIKEHFDYKEQIIKLAKIDLVKTYSGTALGWSWAIIKPAFTIFIYWFAFTVGLRAGKDINGYPFFLWLISGLIPWFYISDMLTGGANSLRKYKYLVTKMRFPISTIPTFVCVSKLMVHIFLIGIMLLIFILMGYYPDIYVIQTLFYTLLTFIFLSIWGLFSSIITAISKDFLNLIKSLMTAFLWLSGILWNPDSVTIPWVKVFLNLNPITFLVNGFRNCFINKIWFWEQPKRLLYFAIITLILLVCALWAYKKVRKDIPDVL